MKHIYFAYCLLVLLILILIPANVECVEPFEVRVIYFKPINAPDTPTGRIKSLMAQAQQLYGTEMERHGYAYKTFRIETDNTDDIVIHTIDGKHTAFHYISNTHEQMMKELPREFKSLDGHTQDRVHLFIVGGVDVINNNRWGVGWPFYGWRCGGTAIVAGNIMSVSLIAHELGHAFGLYHTGVLDAVMGPGDDVFLDYEVRWLNKHHYFNDVHIRTDLPSVVAELPTTAVGGAVVNFKVIANSNSGLYHLQMCRRRNVFVVGHSEASGKSDTISVDVSRGVLVDGESLWYQVMDVHGNYIFKYRDAFMLPEVNKNNTAKTDKSDIKEINDDCPNCDPELDKDNTEKDLAIDAVLLLTTQWGHIKRRIH